MRFIALTTGLVRYFLTDVQFCLRAISGTRCNNFLREIKMKSLPMSLAGTQKMVSFRTIKLRSKQQGPFYLSLMRRWRK